MTVVDTLVARAQAGQRDALVKLIERHQTHVYSICLAIMRNPADASDMSQETFVRLLRTLGNFHGESGAFGSWLHRLTVNICLDALRRQRRGPVSLDEHVLETASADRWQEPVWQTEWRESANEVRAALGELPLPQRVALTLHYFDGSSYEEIASAMGLPLNTVKSHLLRGKQRMARLLARPVVAPRQSAPRPLFRRLSLVAA
jgi:RNA polymerase sigma-70 factor (ECF subfamily)